VLGDLPRKGSAILAGARVKNFDGNVKESVKKRSNSTAPRKYTCRNPVALSAES
jgi:hypothetical protein